MDNNPKERVFKVYKAHPEWTHAQIMQAAGVRNVRYYLLKLAAEGAIKIQPMSRKFKRVVATRKRRMDERGEGGLPRMSAAELMKRIEKVVKKARAVDSGQSTAGGRDVIRIERGKMLRSWKCHKVG